jgi:hypothetical protein
MLYEGEEGLLDVPQLKASPHLGRWLKHPLHSSTIK